MGTGFSISSKRREVCDRHRVVNGMICRGYEEFHHLMCTIATENIILHECERELGAAGRLRQC